MGGPQDYGPKCWELRWFCDKIDKLCFFCWCFLPWLWTVACWFMLLWFLGGCVWSSLWHYRHGIIREQQLTCNMFVSRIGPNKSSYKSSNMCLSWKLMLFLIFPLGLSPQKTGDFWNQDELLHPQPSPNLQAFNRLRNGQQAWHEVPREERRRDLGDEKTVPSHRKTGFLSRDLQKSQCVGRFFENAIVIL